HFLGGLGRVGRLAREAVDLLRVAMLAMSGGLGDEAPLGGPLLVAPEAVLRRRRPVRHRLRRLGGRRPPQAQPGGQRGGVAVLARDLLVPASVEVGARAARRLVVTALRAEARVVLGAPLLAVEHQRPQRDCDGHGDPHGAAGPGPAPSRAGRAPRRLAGGHWTPRARRRSSWWALRTSIRRSGPANASAR